MKALLHFYQYDRVIPFDASMAELREFAEALGADAIEYEDGTIEVFIEEKVGAEVEITP